MVISLFVKGRLRPSHCKGVHRKSDTTPFKAVRCAFAAGEMQFAASDGATDGPVASTGFLDASTPFRRSSSVA
jgi:hypothetical protein